VCSLVDSALREAGLVPLTIFSKNQTTQIEKGEKVGKSVQASLNANQLNKSAQQII